MISTEKYYQDDDIISETVCEGGFIAQAVGHFTMVWLDHGAGMGRQLVLDTAYMNMQNCNNS